MADIPAGYYRDENGSLQRMWTIPGSSYDAKPTYSNSGSAIYGDAPVQQLLAAIQNNTDPNQRSLVQNGWAVGPGLAGSDGSQTYRVYRGGTPGDPSSLAGSAYDIYDAQGNFLGSDKWQDNLGSGAVSGLADFWDKAVPIATMAMIGGGIAGGFGVGPFAPSAAGTAGATGVGATGAGVTGFGDAGAMYAGLSPEAAASLGGGASVYGGAALPAAGAAGVAGAAGGAGGVGGGAAAGGGAANAAGTAGGLLGQYGQYLGPVTTALGALAGSQGNSQQTSATRQLPDYLQGPVSNQLIPYAQGLLSSQMPSAQAAGNQLMSVGSGLLGQTAPTTATNPYVQSILDDMQRRNQQVIDQSLLGIQGNAVATGGLGGSRQGVAQGQAIAQGADNLAGQQAGLLGSLYNQDQNRLLQQQTLGAGLLSQGLSTQWSPLQQAANVYSPFSGFGTTTQDQSSGGGWQGALGGALGAAQLGKNLGWWGNTTTNSNGSTGNTW